MELNSIKPADGAKRARRRVGRLGPGMAATHHNDVEFERRRHGSRI